MSAKRHPIVGIQEWFSTADLAAVEMALASVKAIVAKRQIKVRLAGGTPAFPTGAHVGKRGRPRKMKAMEPAAGE